MAQGSNVTAPLDAGGGANLQNVITNLQNVVTALNALNQALTTALAGLVNPSN